MVKFLWGIVISGLVLALGAVFGLSLLLLADLVHHSLDAGFRWPYGWYPWVGFPVAVLVLGGSGWLLWIVIRVVFSLAGASRKARGAP